MTAHTAHTVIVTGGNAGLGLHAARELAAKGWAVVITSRKERGGAKVAQNIARDTGNSQVTALPLDLADFSSVRAFVPAFLARTDLPPLRAIVANAGTQQVGATTYTKDGFEETFGVNHLGHFLLVQLLLGHLRPPARIVFVASGTHDPHTGLGAPGPYDRSPEALAWPEQYVFAEDERESPFTRGMRRYATSKLANMQTTYELARRLQQQGQAVTVNAYDPGLMPGTGLARSHSALARLLWQRALPILPSLFPGVVSTPRRSGAHLAQLVTDEALATVTGKYFTQGGRSDRPRMLASSPLSYDRPKAGELWRASERMIALPSH